MHLGIDVWSMNPRTNVRLKTTHCLIVFVAVDDQGKPTPVPKWQPLTEADLQLEQYALKLSQLREAIEAEMQGFSEREA